MRQGSAGKKRHLAVVMLLYSAPHGPTQFRTFRQGMHHAQSRNRNYFVMAIGVHVAHGHQGAIFQRQTGVLMRQRANARVIASFGQNVPQRWIAIVLIRHVADEVRQLVAGVVALKVQRIVQVVGRVDQPMRVKHHDGVNTQVAATSVNFMMAIDGGLPCALLRAVQLAQVHGRHMRDFGRE